MAEWMQQLSIYLFYYTTTTMSSSCSALLGALKACLLESDCVQKDGRLPSECLKHHTDELPEACQNLRKATYECKRNMVRAPFDNKDIKSERILLAGYAKEDQGEYGGDGQSCRGEVTGMTEHISKHPGHMTDYKNAVSHSQVNADRHVIQIPRALHRSHSQRAQGVHLPRRTQGRLRQRRRLRVGPLISVMNPLT